MITTEKSPYVLWTYLEADDDDNYAKVFLSPKTCLDVDNGSDVNGGDRGDGQSGN